MQTVEANGRIRLGTLVRIAGWGGAALLLLAPLVAMRFTSEVNWSPMDFAAAGGLIGSTGIALELAAMKSRSLSYRAAFALAILAAFGLTWAFLAVGLVADPGDPVDLLYAGVLGIVAFGGLIVRFEARGMSRVLLLATAAQTLAAAGAFAMGRTLGVPELIALNGVFPALFLASAWLFGRAARAP